MALWQMQLADTLARQGKNDYALAHYQTALNLEPGNPTVWSMTVQFCLANNMEIRRIGLPAARRLVVMTPGDPLAYDLHGRVLLDLGDKDDALQAFFRGLKVDGTSPRLLLDIGGFYFDLQNHDQAFYYLSKAVEMGRKQNQKDIETRAQTLISQLP